MLAFALLLLLGARQDQSPKTVTYTNNGARIEVILPELSKLTGLSLRPSKELAGRALILRLDHAPVQKVLDRIAHVSYGQWAMDHGDYVLYRDQGRIDANIEKARQKHIAAVTEELEKFEKLEPQSKHTFSSNKGDDHFEMSWGPSLEAQTAVKALLRYLDPAIIASLPTGRTFTYSANPRPLQLPLPGEVDAVFARLIEQLRARPKPADPDPFPVPDDSSNNLADNYARGDLDVCQDDDGSVTFTIRAFNDAGKLMFDDIVNPGQVLRDSKPDAPANDAEPSNKRATPFKISKTAKEFFELESKIEPGQQPISDDLRARLMSPLKNDPDSLLGEFLVAYAGAVHRQLVSSPPDRLTDHWFDQLELSPTVESVHKFLEDDGTVDDGAVDGWIETSDAISYPGPGRTERRDRREIARMIETVKDSRECDLKGLVRAYRAHAGELGEIPQDLLYPDLQLDIASNEVLLKFMSGMTDAEIDLLLSGQTLNLGSFNDSVKAAFTSEVTSTIPFTSLCEDSPPSITYDTAGNVESMLAGVGRDAPPPRSDDLWKEFSEVANNFAPPEARVQMFATETPSMTVILPPGTDGADMPGALGFNGLPNPAFFETDNDGNPLKGPKPWALGIFSSGRFGNQASTRYRIGTNRSYVLRVIYAPFVCWQGTGTLTTFDDKSVPLKYSQLSDAQKQTMSLYDAWMQKQIEEEERERLKQQSGGDAGGKSGPP